MIMGAGQDPVQTSTVSEEIESEGVLAPVGSEHGDLNERGMTTAEYAVGTVAAVSFAGILLKVLTNPEVQEALLQFIIWLIRLFSDLQPF